MIIKSLKHNLFLIIGFVLALAILLGVAIYSQKIIEDLINSFKWASQAQSMLVNFEELSGLLHTAELNERNYLITNKEEYLQRYKDAVFAIPTKSLEIKLASNNPEQQEASVKLDLLLKEGLADLEQNISYYIASDNPIELIPVISRNNLYMGRIRSHIEEMSAQEKILYQRRSVDTERAGILTNQIITAGNFFAICLLTLIGWILFREVSKRVRVEHAIKMHVHELEDLYNHTPCGYYSLDDSGLIVKANDTWLEWLGYQKGEVVGKMYLTDIIKGDHLDFFKDIFANFKQSGVIKDIQCDYRRKDGSYVPVSVSATAIKDINGKYLMSRNSVFDISELKRAEKQANTILDSAPDAMLITDKSGAIRLLNAQAEKLFGYTKDEFTQLKVEALIPERERAKHLQHRNSYFSSPKVREMGTGLELYGQRKDGAEFPIEVSLSPFEMENGIWVCCVVRDITERKQADQALRRSNVFLNSLIDNIPNMIFVKDAETLRFVQFNKAGEELLGYSKSELVGKNDYDFFPPEEAEAFIAKDKEVIRHGQLFDVLEEPIHTRHKGLRLLHTMKIPLFDAQGNPEYLLGISEDITARREAEVQIQQLNQNLIRHSRQLEVSNRELESFSYSVSHDLRAPLRAINGFSKMLQEDYKDKIDDQGNRWLNVIRDNSGRMSKLIDDLLAFSKVGRKPLNFATIDMDVLIDECIAETEATKKIEWRKSSLGMVEGDRPLLKQVWINLLSNAVKYSSQCDVSIIEIFSFSENNKVIYAIKDNGVGFDMQYYDKLFGVFERLHKPEEFSGTGVGLAIAQRIIVKHGGRIWAESKLKEGATFYFTLGKETEAVHVSS